MTVRRGFLIALPLALALLGAFLLGGATHSTKPADAADFAPMHVLKSPRGEVAAVVLVTIHDRKVPFIVDTGASSSVIDLKAAEKLGLRPIGKAYAVRGVGGKSRALPIMIDNWSIGPVPLPKLRIETSSLSKQTKSGAPIGLLGSDVLSRYKSVTLDFGREQLQLGR
jgi:clan AA aspartic protease (TIGR02281 family)